MSCSKMTVVPLLGLIGWLAGCSTAGVVPRAGGSATAQVTGSVAYRERVALPPTAVIRVQLVDVSRADAPSVVLGEQRIEAGGKQQMSRPQPQAADVAGAASQA